jgi:hypothetical protein
MRGALPAKIAACSSGQGEITVMSRLAMLLRAQSALASFAIALSALCASGQAADPAVSALNGKFSLEGGPIGSQGGQSAVGIAQGSVSAPLGQSFGVQVDGAAATASSSFFGGGGVQAFWRDPAIGLLGPAAAIFGLPGSRTGLYVGEAEYYAGIVTLGAMAGYKDVVSFRPGNASSGGYFQGQVRLYPLPDLALSLLASSAAGKFQGAGIVEYQPQFATLHNIAFFAEASAGDNSTYWITAGIRFYFGADKTLIRRHREDDPSAISSAITGLEAFQQELALIGNNLANSCITIKAQSRGQSSC